MREERIARIRQRLDDVVRFDEGNVGTVRERGEQCGRAARARLNADDPRASDGLHALGVGLRRELSKLCRLRQLAKLHENLACDRFTCVDIFNLEPADAAALGRERFGEKEDGQRRNNDRDAD